MAPGRRASGPPSADLQRAVSLATVGVAAMEEIGLGEIIVRSGADVAASPSSAARDTKRGGLRCNRKRCIGVLLLDQFA